MYPDQVDMYLAQVPRLLYMQHYPIASAMASWGNSQGGKSKGGKTLAPEKTFKAEDFLFHMAHYQPYLNSEKPVVQHMGVDQETARLILDLNTFEEGGKRKSKLEAWMVGALADVWDEILKVSA